MKIGSSMSRNRVLTVNVLSAVTISIRGNGVELKDHERLIVGYAHLYYNMEQCVQLIQPIVNQHSTWAIARSILAPRREPTIAKPTVRPWPPIAC